MKVECIKLPGGILAPVNDAESQKLTAIKTGEQYTIEFKLMRNPKFHKKAFAFLNFCFQHWAVGGSFLDERTQLEKFRKELTILAGYYNEVFDFRGNLTLEAKSISCGNMAPDEFSSWYQSSIQVAMTNIFKTDDQRVYDQLISFF